MSNEQLFAGITRSIQTGIQAALGASQNVPTSAPPAVAPVARDGSGKMLIPQKQAAQRKPWQKDERQYRTVVGTHPDGTQIVVGYHEKFGFGVSGHRGSTSAFIEYHSYDTWKALAALAPFMVKAISEHWAVEPSVPTPAATAAEPKAAPATK